jgi:hypothetical protein
MYAGLPVVGFLATDDGTEEKDPDGTYKSTTFHPILTPPRYGKNKQVIYHNSTGYDVAIDGKSLVLTCESSKTDENRVRHQAVSRFNNEIEKRKDEIKHFQSEITKSNLEQEKMLIYQPANDDELLEIRRGIKLLHKLIENNKVSITEIVEAIKAYSLSCVKKSTTTTIKLVAGQQYQMPFGEIFTWFRLSNNIHANPSTHVLTQNKYVVVKELDVNVS